jgi:CBS domain containing-hemolysin-like protein
MIALFAIAICLLVSGIFSGIEAGILSINRVRLRHQVKLREKAALRLNRLLAHPERLLITVLIVTNLMNVLAVALSTQLLVARIGHWGYLVAFVVWLPVYLGVELFPKSLFRRFPFRALAIFSEMLRLADWLLAPLLAVGSAMYRKFFAKKESELKKIFIAREDFKYLTIESERSGVLRKTEREMIHNVLDFRNVAARDLMIPRASVRTIANTAPVEELLAISRSEHIERLPVASGSGDIVGIVNVFEVLLDRRDTGGVGAHTRRIVSVAHDESAYNLIRKLRAARCHLAAILDPDGKTLGVVRYEDLIKRLVGTPG